MSYKELFARQFIEPIGSGIIEMVLAIPIRDRTILIGKNTYISMVLYAGGLTFITSFASNTLSDFLLTLIDSPTWNNPESYAQESIRTSLTGLLNYLITLYLRHRQTRIEYDNNKVVALRHVQESPKRQASVSLASYNSQGLHQRIKKGKHYSVSSSHNNRSSEGSNISKYLSRSASEQEDDRSSPKSESVSRARSYEPKNQSSGPFPGYNSAGGDRTAIKRNRRSFSQNSNSYSSEGSDLENYLNSEGTPDIPWVMTPGPPDKSTRANLAPILSNISGPAVQLAAAQPKIAQTVSAIARSPVGRVASLMAQPKIAQALSVATRSPVGRVASLVAQPIISHVAQQVEQSLLTPSVPQDTAVPVQPPIHLSPAAAQPPIQLSPAAVQPPIRLSPAAAQPPIQLAPAFVPIQSSMQVPVVQSASEIKHNWKSYHKDAFYVGFTGALAEFISIVGYNGIKSHIE